MPSAIIESSEPSPRVRRSPAEPPPTAQVSPEAIAQRAYELYLQRGAEHGNDVEDWLLAETELLQERNTRLADA